MNVDSQNTVIILILLIKCLCDQMKWGEWCRHWDIALDYYGPSDMKENHLLQVILCHQAMMILMVRCQEQGCHWLGQDWAGQREYHHRAFPNGAQFKTHELFVSGNFHLVFSDLSWPQELEPGRRNCWWGVTTI